MILPTRRGWFLIFQLRLGLHMLERLVNIVLGEKQTLSVMQVQHHRDSRRARRAGRASRYCRRRHYQPPTTERMRATLILGLPLALARCNLDNRETLAQGYYSNRG